MATNNAINTSLPFSVTNGGTGQGTLAANNILVGAGTDQIGTIVLTDGQVLIGQTSDAPLPATLTAGSGINITSVAGSITIAATGTEGFTWNTVSGTTQTLASSNGYISANAGLVTYTTPATASLGAEFKVVAYRAGGFTIVPGGAGQTIMFGTHTTAVDTGSITSTEVGDAIDFVCVDATTAGSEVFMVLNSVGNLTVV